MMDSRQARQILAVAFPGQPLDKAFLNLTALFITPLNQMIARVSQDKNLEVENIKVGGKNYRVDMVRYPKNKPADVAVRAIGLTILYPNAVANYAASRGLDESPMKAPETGEPITILIVVGIIATLGPVVFPFIVDLVNSFLNNDAKQKKAEADAVTAQAEIEAETKAKKDKQTQQIIGVVVVAVVLVIGVVAYRRLI